ncbi:hypothetical protein [Erwinia amylovora]|uniref:hypothetical protein n=2 Tax=Erwinia amylovora TaxID=552 RepID=UPI001965E3F4|nr:hypothetical protein [Erwinia amylovora]
MAIRVSLFLIAPGLIFLCSNSYAESCGKKSCGGLPLPASARQFISNGYSKVDINFIKNSKYLFLSSENDVNRCSVIFKIKRGKIESEPFMGQNGKLCNLSEAKDSVVSLRRDQGVWYNDIYKVESEKPWVLLFTDSCTDCQQVKRTYFINGIEVRKELLSEGDDFSSRKILSGVISTKKAFLYSQPDDQKKTKAYLIEGDVFTLADMSDDGAFYQIVYKSSTGKDMFFWIKSDGFDLS